MANSKDFGKNPYVVVNLNSIDYVKEFVRITEQQDFNVDIVSYNTSYIIDAKSIMGIFSLDLSKNCYIVAHATQEEAADFFKKIEKFVVNE